MFRRNKQLRLAANAKSVQPKDPLYAFKSDSQEKETGRFEVRGEIWKQVKKLLYVAGILIALWFLVECYDAWNFFQ